MLLTYQWHLVLSIHDMKISIQLKQVPLTHTLHDHKHHKVFVYTPSVLQTAINVIFSTYKSLTPAHPPKYRVLALFCACTGTFWASSRKYLAASESLSMPERNGESLALKKNDGPPPCDKNKTGCFCDDIALRGQLELLAMLCCATARDTKPMDNTRQVRMTANLIRFALCTSEKSHSAYK